ncbi:hypothetical protein OXX79_009575 [Metschnikowia pulcherrima]
MVCFNHWTIVFLFTTAAAGIINSGNKRISLGTRESTDHRSMIIRINSSVSRSSARKRSIPGYGQLGVPITGPEDSTARLTNIIQELKSFVHGDQFDTLGFDKLKFTLKIRVTECLSWVNENDGVDKAISAQILYAANLIRFMEDSVELLKFYSLPNSQAHKLINSLIRFNLRLVLPFDSIGNPDRKRDGYTDMVVESLAKISDINEQFRSLGEVSLGFSVAFNNQIARAQNTVSTLADRL